MKHWYSHFAILVKYPYGMSYWSHTVVFFQILNQFHCSDMITFATGKPTDSNYLIKLLTITTLIQRFCFIGALLHPKLSELVCVLWKQDTINSVTQSIIFEVPGTFRQWKRNRLRLSIFGNSTLKFNLGNVIKCPMSLFMCRYIYQKVLCYFKIVSQIKFKI